ncbi:MAG: hypothetical protein MAGBODY4_00956 [Candidatus Marinimicrobia bacterium]|nr:hypothetical protein [Candidatus Neomarinimicrobiota bacterium]
MDSKHWIVPGLLILVTLIGCAVFAPPDKMWHDIPVSDVEQRYPIPEKAEYLRFKQENLSRIHRLDSIFTMEGIVIPVERVLQQGSDWQDLNMPAYALPPDSLIMNMILTLRLLQEEIVPRIGEVVIVSGYRTPEYNEPAGGASRSRHLFFDAVDVAPVTDIPERVLKKRLRKFYYEHGEEYNLGLGLYDHKRFHVDTWKYRNWGDWPGEE